MKNLYTIILLSLLTLASTTTHATWNPFKQEEKERKEQMRNAVIATALLISGGAITLEVLDLAGYTKTGGLPRALSLLALTMVDAVTNRSRYVWSYVPMYVPVYPYTPVFTPIYPVYY